MDFPSSQIHKRIKVLHIYRTYFPDQPGGIQEAIRQICISAREFGIESEVMALSPNCYRDTVQLPEAKVWRSRSWWAPASCDLGGFSAFRLFTDCAARADILHFHFPWPFADLLNMLQVARKPKVMTYHSDIVRQRTLSALYSPVMHMTLASMDTVVATSPPYIKTSRVLQALGAAGKVRAIPLGIQDHFMDYIKQAAVSNAWDGIRDQLNLPSGKFVLALGVLRYYKGFHTLIEAANQINCPIVIAGTGPEAETLKTLAQSHRANNVIFAGRVSEDQKRNLLAQCTLFVLPSQLRSEAFGMVLVEASMFAKPMVTCEIGTGTSFVNLNQETGLVVPPNSPQILAMAISKLLTNETLARKFGLAARERYKLLFSGDALGKAYARLYQDTILKRKK